MFYDIEIIIFFKAVKSAQLNFVQNWVGIPEHQNKLFWWAYENL